MRGKLLWVLSSAAVMLFLATPVRSEYLACHFYTGVVADSDGFVFYAHHHAHHEDGHYWKMVERLFEQMAPLRGAIGEGRMSDPRVSVDVDEEKLVYRYGVDPESGKNVLVAVNIARWDARDNDGQTLENVRFTLPEEGRPQRVAVHGEERTVAVEDGHITDEFAPFAVHVYTWELAGPRHSARRKCAR